jgi:putative oxidoreductase
MKLPKTFDPERRSPAALTLLRVGIGVIMMAHGWMKLQDPGSFTETLSGMGFPAPEVMTWLAIAGELGGGALLALGLLTPLGGFAVASTMAVAVVVFHGGNGLFAKNGGWEFPGLLMVGAIFFMFRGAGKYSLDALIARKALDRDRPHRGAHSGAHDRPREATA